MAPRSWPERLGTEVVKPILVLRPFLLFSCLLNKVSGRALGSRNSPLDRELNTQAHQCIVDANIKKNTSSAICHPSKWPCRNGLSRPRRGAAKDHAGNIHPRGGANLLLRPH